MFQQKTNFLNFVPDVDDFKQYRKEIFMRILYSIPHNNVMYLSSYLIIREDKILFYHSTHTKCLNNRFLIRSLGLFIR